ncbi:hypothetical protein RJ639_008588 [Escallonia herrerae]|uniref:Uncharacterized protein n=1 Tax=Escallonia herrerae TaxID=1293975 RepID=A0AA89ARR2_9ASTE|nr:hypothetical protein RJ639_008588 [Escallonia herrerae]
MKSISGRVTSSKPISLSKAAETLTNFASSDNGASQAVSTYLKRAAAEFTELAHFHKLLNSSHSGRKPPKHQSTSIVAEHPVRTEQNSIATVQRHQDSEGKRRKHRLAKLNSENPEKIGQNPQEGRLENGGVRQKQKRNRSENAIDESRSEERPIKIEERDLTNAEDSARKREKEKKKDEVGQREGGRSLGNEKKRKTREFTDEEVLNLGEQKGTKKKKKRRVGVEG